MLRFFLFISIIASSLSCDTLIFGIFAYRPDTKIIEQYQPLADHIAHELNTTIILKVLSQEELEKEVHAGKIDIVATNPTHFIALRAKHTLTGAIATELKNYNGIQTPYLGGVIITRFNTINIHTISDLRNKIIAIPGKKFLGGYQTQNYELLKQGIHLPADATLREMKNHDAVVKAVLSGEVDAGFVRTGIIEEMTKENELDPSKLFIVNEQHYENFPLKISTPLYPEWAIAVSAHKNHTLIKQIAAAIYSYTPKVTATGKMDGFTIPADYSEIDSLARTLRLPPYEHAPSFTAYDVWDKYHIIILILVIVSIIIAIAVNWAYKKMSFQKAYTQSILDVTPTPLIVTNGYNLITANRTFLEYLEYDSLSSFQRDHSCVCDYFEEGETDDYLLPVVNNQAWTSYIIDNPDKKHKAKITIHGKTTIFDIRISSMLSSDNNRYIATFTDITSILSQSTTDALTGLANRLHFNMVFEHALHIAHREMQPLGIIFLDIDHFKCINDDYGHLIGDLVLKEVALLLQKSIRKSDIIARWGGEEFVIVLPNTTLEQTTLLAESLRKAIENEPFDIVGNLTCSFGVTKLKKNETSNELMKQADVLLYLAKNSGRNKVIIG